MIFTPALETLVRLQEYQIEYLDRETAELLLYEMNRAETEMSSGFDQFASDSISYSKSRIGLKRIQLAQKLLEARLHEKMVEQAPKYFSHATDSVDKEVKQFEGYFAPTTNRDLISLKQSQFLLNNMHSSLTTYSADIRRRVSDAITQATLQRISGYEVQVKLRKFLDIKKYRIQRIVRTEMSGIFNRAKLIGYTDIRDNYFGDLKKTLFNPMDSRTAEDSKYVDRLNMIIPLHEEFKYVWDGKTYEGMSPPFRPNDRAVLIPYRPKWDKKIVKKN